MRDEKELKASLLEQLGFLESSSREFDDGKLAEAKRIANSIYTIVHDKNQAKSILGQLEIKEKIDFVATGKEYTPPNDPTKKRYSSPPLLNILSGGSKGLEFVPKLGNSARGHRKLKFEDWWKNDPIYWYQEEGDKDGTYREVLLSREELILTITDQDGGRHLDPKVRNNLYKRMKETRDWKNALTGQPIDIKPELKTARQIGWELTESLRAFGYHLNQEDTKKKLFEISGKKMRFFSDERGLVERNRKGFQPIPGKDYSVEITVDSISKGSVRVVINSTTTDPITTIGFHSIRIVAGDGELSGIFGEYTDAVIDRISFKPVGN